MSDTNGSAATRVAMKNLYTEEDEACRATGQRAAGWKMQDEQRSQAAQKLQGLRIKLVSVLEDVPRSTNGGLIYLSDRAHLEFGSVHSGPASPIANLDIMAWAPITLLCNRLDGGRYQWSATIMYASNETEGPSWREVGFFPSPMGPRDNRDAPFAMDPCNPNFPLGPCRSLIEIAYGPKLIEGEHSDAFVNRWATMFKLAMEGKFVRPSRFPIDI